MTETILVRDFCPSNGHFLHIQRPQDITTRKKVIDFVQEHLTQECFNFLLEQNLQVLRFGGPNFQLDFEVYPWSAVKNIQTLLHFKITAYPDEEIATFHYVCPDQLKVCKNNPLFTFCCPSNRKECSFPDLEPLLFLSIDKELKYGPTFSSSRF